MKMRTSKLINEHRVACDTYCTESRARLGWVSLCLEHATHTVARAASWVWDASQAIRVCAGCSTALEPNTANVHMSDMMAAESATLLGSQLSTLSTPRCAAALLKDHCWLAVSTYTPHTHTVSARNIGNQRLKCTSRFRARQTAGRVAVITRVASMADWMYAPSITQRCPRLWSSRGCMTMCSDSATRTTPSTHPASPLMS